MFRWRYLIGLVVFAVIVLGGILVVRLYLPPPPPPPPPEPTSTPRPTPLPTFANITPTFRVNLDDFAPPGRGRDLLIYNCGNCHTFACALIGQRTLAHWETVSLTHYEKMGPSLPDADYNEIFGYLEKNFNDQMPEPELSPDLLGKGCTTPFR